MDSRGQFTFYRSYFDALEELPDEDQLRIYRGICGYALDGIEPALSGISKAVFTLIRPTLDSGRKKAVGGKSSKTSSEDTGKIPERSKEDTAKTKARARKDSCDEKEREKEKEKEVEIENECYSCAEQASSPPVITLPLNDKTEYPIFVEQCQEWAGLYPAVDVIQQLRNMRGWLQANPTKRKTKTGVLRFVASWLAREQDKGSSSPSSGYSRKDVPKGASGDLGEAELEAIRRVLQEE